MGIVFSALRQTMEGRKVDVLIGLENRDGPLGCKGLIPLPSSNQYLRRRAQASLQDLLGRVRFLAGVPLICPVAQWQSNGLINRGRQFDSDRDDQSSSNLRGFASQKHC